MSSKYWEGARIYILDSSEKDLFSDFKINVVIYILHFICCFHIVVAENLTNEGIKFCFKKL